MRLFIAIELPLNIKTEVARIYNLFPPIKGTLVEVKNLHLTLAFLGDVPQDKILALEKTLEKVGESESDFDISLGDLIGIPNNKPRLLALNIKNPQNFYNLQKQVVLAVKKVDMPADAKPPHLTLIRLKTTLLQAPKLTIPTLLFKVSQFILFQSILTSKGPIYKPLKAVKLTSGSVLRPLRPNLAICVINPKNEILLIRRSDHHIRDWQFPQGGIKPGDSLKQTLVKEIKEELGITQFETILIKEQVHKYLWSKKLREKGTDLEKKPYFGQEQSLAIIRLSKDRPKLKPDPREAAEVKWVPYNKLILALHPVRRALGRLTMVELEKMNILTPKP
jgi:2'-5' RNA ligase